MVPKPFPYPLNIGTDLCSVKRVAGLLSHRRPREQFVRRNFTRLEWPLIWKSFQRASDSPNSYNAWIKPNTASVSHFEQIAKAGERPLAEDLSIWSLPDWAKPRKSYNEEVLEETSPIGNLIRHVAGRFASIPHLLLHPQSSQLKELGGPQMGSQRIRHQSPRSPPTLHE